MLDTRTIELSRNLEGKAKIEYGFSLVSEFEKLEQEGHIKIIDKKLDTNIGILTVDTFYEGKKKAQKSRYRPKGYRKGNMFFFVLGGVSGTLSIKNRTVFIEPDIFLKCELWKYTWNVEQYNTNWYATTKDKGKKIFMHRLIKSGLYGNESIEGKDIDHIGHYGLDNRLEHIRKATRQENIDNKDAIQEIKQNKVTKMYYLDDMISEENYLYYDLFDIKINIERPEPMKDLIELQQKVIEYYKELDRANEKLENNPLYLKWINGEVDDELEAYLERNFEKNNQRDILKP